MTTTARILKQLREAQPLIHHITNWVTIYDCANMTRAFGALPVMAHAPEESGEMATLASALVLNIGTLTPKLIEAMLLAGAAANAKGAPVVFDAVGVGATRLRDDMAQRLLNEIEIDVIKGNASEIARLAGEDVLTKGVETTAISGDPEMLVQHLATRCNGTVVLTGPIDYIANAQGHRFKVRNGHAMMGAIVGTGCMSASIIAAFAAIEPDYAQAAASALACFGIAGELAAARTRGPGSFKAAFYDEVYNLTDVMIDKLIDVDDY